MSHPNKFSVHGHLIAHDAQILELQQAVKSVVLSPGPQGKQGQTGASGADGRDGNPGRDGKDGRDAVGVKGDTGLQGPIGIQGRRGERGERGEKGDSIAGPAGPQGEKGERGDVCYIGPAEVEAAVAAVRKELLTQRAKFLGAIEQALADSGGTSGAHQLIRARLERVKRDAGL
jgi:hypothetical protein